MLINIFYTLFLILPHCSKALDMKKGEVYRGNPKSGKPDATLTLEDADMMQIVNI